MNSKISLFLIAASWLATAAPGQQGEKSAAPFPASTAKAEALSSDALVGLGRLVQGFVDDEEVVGAELLVIKNGRSVLHEAYGWRDRESEARMEPGSVFCVRSMTKPVIGAAVLMLLDEGKLRLDDRVSKYLPSFDADSTRDITVEHLLSHTSGLPMSLLVAKDLKELGNIRAVADLGGGHALGFEPGAGFEYSDQGTDTLAALVEIVSKQPVADFVRARVLAPLGMTESTCVMTAKHPLRSKACSKYGGTAGRWMRFWSPEDAPLFPFFLGSQGLYATLTDYARFLRLWMDGGTAAGGQRLVAADRVRSALSPRNRLGGTGLPGAQAEYGYLMQVWSDGKKKPGRTVAFGHGGSDGTHAWAFPEQDAMVLYFTQSRGNTTAARVEEALGRLLLGAESRAKPEAPPLEQYLGYYWEGEGDLYRSIVVDGDDLALEIGGRAVVPLEYVGDDRWRMRPNPSAVLAFDRGPEGEVTGYRIGDHQEYRFEPSKDLPSAEELATRVAKTHRIDLIGKVGPVRMNAKLRIKKLDLSGSVTMLLAAPHRFRIDTNAGENFEKSSFDGEAAWYASTMRPAGRLEGPAADVRGLDPFVRWGDWSKSYPRMQVIQQLEKGGRKVVLVRAGDATAPAPTYWVDLESGRLMREDSLTHVEGMGRLSQRRTFGDYRDVSGVLLPHRYLIETPNPMLGIVKTLVTVESIDTGIEVTDAAFRLEN